MSGPSGLLNNGTQESSWQTSVRQWGTAADVVAGNEWFAKLSLDPKIQSDRYARPRSLELREVISEVADDLLDLTEWDIDEEEGGEGAESLLRKYPPV